MTWHDDLSPEQKEKAEHFGSHARLLAGPGTGKTRTMTGRIAFLLQEKNVSAGEILALTFTRAAASELRKRIAEHQEGGSIPKVTTLHSFALQSLLQLGAGNRLPSPIRIADDFEERQIIEEDIKDLLDLPKVKNARDLIDLLSADWEMLSAEVDDWAHRFPNPRFLGAWQEHRTIYGYTLQAELVYQLKKALEEGTRRLANSPLHVLVDEYQDLNACDLSVINSLARGGATLYVAGDDDQSIYGFRHADPTGIRRFLEEYPGSEPLTLSECHRCGQNILTIADYVAEQDIRRLIKPLTPCSMRPGEVHLLEFNDFDDEANAIARISRWLVETKGITPDQILVLIRSNKHHRFSNPICAALQNQGIPATTVENPLNVFEQDQGRVFISFLRLMVNRNDNLAWRNLIKIRDNDLGDVAVASIYEIARNKGITFFEALSLIANNPVLIPRQGEAIKTEYETTNNMLDRLNATNEHADNLSEFIHCMVNELLAIEHGEEMMEVIEHIISDNSGISLEDFLREIVSPMRDKEQVRVEGKVNVMTMHQAKGLDAEVIFVAAAEDEYIPGRAQGNEIDDERRLLYVSLTRARSFLYVTYCNHRTGIQQHTGRSPLTASRNLTRFLSGGPVRRVLGQTFVAGLD
ncbi:DNA helicase-2 / ATP-dependent DNA helicase PcrA [Dehalogenimonas formicexedens]|uniref:DNA 3'-5' helicase n=1 Tax=Dehalogenimonas formicexedens TaxID=1839801 RepID=A0A1P8F9B4_9CHLR|nr:ATP-dependent helicase [Dehalogenimonas formicexedens]APV45038.1 DNA helicase-2 / ATP-dependent DNA helicase PcrA [Dehalogenimonas formicexedens]